MFQVVPQRLACTIKGWRYYLRLFSLRLKFREYANLHSCCLGCSNKLCLLRIAHYTDKLCPFLLDAPSPVLQPAKTAPSRKICAVLKLLEYACSSLFIYTLTTWNFRACFCRCKYVSLRADPTTVVTHIRQLWDTRPPTGPRDSWTIHGIYSHC
jgi:hypothetical protein